ncbi:hypothetical protein HXX76_003504 [Chlamydomonas incerta]|uniref:Uncharacterized protein n=1 Tax=Chlamydomonas incerta TaxID=51695 RepID=A0A835W8R0_CHLIN|nr:hypothetical protein HXX76_003504 [Chlamydomonas incerta]|eukprot:KAG2441898.1 hypothetical protein HXX76_003504 [Chlamydomonas incerta]
MKSSSTRRSTSLLRGAARQRSSTPSSSRRLSDLAERPAWDATSSNLDKLKLSAEELERRKASRVSKNRPVPSSVDTKHDYVAAWARTSSASTLRLDPDAERDQDTARTPHAEASGKAQLPALDYGSVVESLRRSPAVGQAVALAKGAQRAINESVRGENTAGPQSMHEEEKGLAGGVDRTQADTAALNATLAPAAAPVAQDRQAAAINGYLERPAATLHALGAAEHDNGSGAHRSEEVDIIPAALRPRFHAADTTTIISCSDQDGELEDEEAEELAPSAAAFDSMTAAFEEALFGRPPATAAAATASVAHRGWTSAAPINHASDDVERRLRALEACVASAGSDVSAADVAELRGELRKVQLDNAKLRQELATFSTHASALLTQLQAQVQQLLRTSGGGGGGMAPASGSAAAQPRSQAAAQQQPSMAAVASVSSTASLPAPVSMQYLQQQPPTVVRRNIFTDIPDSSRRPASTGGDALRGGGGRVAGVAAEPGSRVAGMAVATAASPRAADMTAGGLGLGAAPSPYAPRPVPLNNVEDADVALPSFAAFRPTPAPSTANGGSAAPSPLAYDYGAVAPAAAGLGSDVGASMSVAQRSFPSAFQPRNLSGTIARAGPSTAPGGVLLTGEQRGGAAAAGLFAAATAAEMASAASGGAYAAALAASAASAAATGSGPAAVELARSHAGLPLPLVFSVGQEFRSVRASGLAAHDSMSLSAHVAAAAAARGKSSLAR